MKTLFRYIWRSKVDLAIWIFTISVFVQWFVASKDLTYGFIIMILYVFGVIVRLGVCTDHLIEQDQDIKKLNERIHEKDKFITELIKKYGNPKEGAAFLNKMKSKLKSEK